jgi:hypothetical protein
MGPPDLVLKSINVCGTVDYGAGAADLLCKGWNYFPGSKPYIFADSDLWN